MIRRMWRPLVVAGTAMAMFVVGLVAPTLAEANDCGWSGNVYAYDYPEAWFAADSDGVGGSWYSRSQHTSADCGSVIANFQGFVNPITLAEYRGTCAYLRARISWGDGSVSWGPSMYACDGTSVVLARGLPAGIRYRVVTKAELTMYQAPARRPFAIVRD